MNSFEFASGQLRDIQLYIHARFVDMDDRFAEIGRVLQTLTARFDKVDSRFDKVEAKLDALPRVLAEFISKKS